MLPAAGSAGAGLYRVAVIATGTGICASNQRKLCWKLHRLASPGNCDIAVFQRLTQVLQHISLELCQLIKITLPYVDF